ncbi:glutamyl-tRNA synthetase [Thecamonas trahens ATCC 50062]|uniref:glutamate--tRNA ligase n=1 Tax=Thecamonas trahens ATCC 50062 TaxID=461836 RepID=A0A0L0DH10_THETB|nr:glutamyl-tRNA synthetase [Thecamonas trahens ATCC 50062]KNC50593.1 glutamyl-tRNA synthetase [Thecamonas trahens ATCC 50062]|eukprot:XP_013762480.1 glutamyl-tRNA synthetase [Thecamonas trahens ATCC 50062]
MLRAGARSARVACGMARVLSSSSAVGRVALDAAPATTRVRFAPSPTGALHLGGLRTALFNYLFARATGGEFVVRIEDTDASRTVPGARAALLDALAWAGLTPDDAPVAEPAADDARLVQSARTAEYAQAAEALMDAGAAYRCFCTPAELDAEREAARRAGRLQIYSRRCMGLAPEEARARAAGGEAHVVRLKVPQGSSVFHDAVFGTVRVANAQIDDQVLVKSDGLPTYHLANVVDDAAMHMTHVIRGQEWLISTPKHVMMYEALGLRPPTFVHLPLLLDTAKRKLSKRDASSSVDHYRQQGFLPSALLNFVAFLGWSPNDAALAGVDAQAMSLDDLVDVFSLDDINKGGAIVDYDKALAVNGTHLASLFKPNPPMAPEQAAASRAGLVAETAAALSAAGTPASVDYVDKVWAEFAPSLSLGNELVATASYMFAPPPHTACAAASAELHALPQLDALITELDALSEWDADAINGVLTGYRNAHKLKPRQVLFPLRVGVTGARGGPPLASLFALLGKAECMDRLRRVM